MGAAGTVKEEVHLVDSFEDELNVAGCDLDDPVLGGKGEEGQKKGDIDHQFYNNNNQGWTIR